MFHPQHRSTFAGTGTGVVQSAKQCLIQHLINKAAFAGAGNSRNANYLAKVFRKKFGCSPSEFRNGAEPDGGSAPII